MYSSYQELIADKLIGPFLAYSSNNCFVVVDGQDSICGYVFAVLDSTSFNESIATNWIPYVSQKYPLTAELTETTELAPVKQVISSFHNPSKPILPTSERYPSLVRIDILRHCRDSVLGDPSAVKRALACAAIALKVCGSKGIHALVDSKHTNTIETYRTLGFVDISTVDCHDSICVMGRPI
jgi:hypothetical protein